VEFDGGGGGDLLVMVMVNTVSSWVELSLLRKTADFHAIWKQFREKVITQHEVPEHVTNDNDVRHGDRFKSAMNRYGIKWYPTIPHTHGNGKAERMARVVRAAVDKRAHQVGGWRLLLPDLTGFLVVLQPIGLEVASPVCPAPS
jgi:hypothetical protein